MRLLLALVLCSVLQAEPQTMLLDSEKASFDGKILTLEGNVHINHSMGNIYSQKAVVNALSTKEKSLHVYLENNVELLFPSEGSISCGKAHFDYGEKKASFSGLTEEDKILFKDCDLLKLSCLKAFAELKSKLKFSALSFLDIQVLTFLGEVEIAYDAVIAKGGKAVFKRDCSDKKFLGTLNLYPALPKERCRIFHSQGEIFSRNVCFDLYQNTLTFDDPSGSVSFPQQKEKDPLLFSAKKLTWQKNQNAWILEDKVHLNERNAALFESDKVTLLQKENGYLYKTVAMGKSKVSFLGKNKGDPELFCNGCVTLDNDAKKITATAEKEYVIFYDGSLFLSAKEAHFSYDIENQKLLPQEICFEGDVRFMSDEVLESQTLGIADAVTYFPEKHKLLLTSAPSKKVLLWQENNSLRLSANEIHIERDPLTSKEIAKGIGDVRFSFDTTEEQELKKTFGSYLKIK